MLDYLETHLDEHLKIIKREVGDVLEGEPRYSVEEFDKIFESKEFTDFFAEDKCFPLGMFSNLLEFMKDRKKVEEILK